MHNFRLHRRFGSSSIIKKETNEYKTKKKKNEYCDQTSRIYYIRPEIVMLDGADNVTRMLGGEKSRETRAEQKPKGPRMQNVRRTSARLVASDEIKSAATAVAARRNYIIILLPNALRHSRGE